MALLDFNKPKKIHSTELHNKTYMSDSGVAGTYVPNMSKTDAEKWKAKQITGDDPRIEIRKSFQFSNGIPWREKESFNAVAQIVIIVRPDNNTTMPQVLLSTNSKIPFTLQLYSEFQQVVEEARNILNE